MGVDQERMARVVLRLGDTGEMDLADAIERKRVEIGDRGRSRG